MLAIAAGARSEAFAIGIYILILLCWEGEEEEVINITNIFNDPSATPQLGEGILEHPKGKLSKLDIQGKLSKLDIQGKLSS